MGASARVLVGAGWPGQRLRSTGRQCALLEETRGPRRGRTEVETVESEGLQVDGQLSQLAA